MYTALSAKNKVRFIDGTATPPQKEDDSYHAWTRCNNMVVSWLVYSVSPDIRCSILWMDNTQAIWDDLKSRFFQGDLLRISELQNEAAALKQGERTVTEYFTKLCIIWDELDNFRPEPTCSCETKCSCKLTSTIAQRKHEDQILQFLRELNEQYSNIQHVVVVGIVTCSYCGKNGHNESICFKKHGFPANKNTTGKKVCSHCGKTGHTIELCYRKHEFPPGYKLYNGKSFMTTNQDAKNDGLADANDREVRLTQQQYQALMSLINESDQFYNILLTDTGKFVFTLTSHEGKGIISWILDSGATNHVSSSLTHLSSYEKITPVTINLPNGMQTTATHKGIVKIGEHIILKDDLTTNNKIGSVEINGGLYIFRGSTNITQRFTHSIDKHTPAKSDCKNIWHNRLGHLSDQRLEILRQKANLGWVDGFNDSGVLVRNVPKKFLGQKA
ncbi:hypothetical protein V8G54_018510 [Vigna mungo]|uniref:CCHC-type domain-containing protein n=1 Tax=Vigna mungo TaxID=3915 RepID=A0AAQ3RUP0_VIGMU